MTHVQSAVHLIISGALREYDAGTTGQGLEQVLKAIAQELGDWMEGWDEKKKEEVKEMF